MAITEANPQISDLEPGYKCTEDVARALGKTIVDIGSQQAIGEIPIAGHWVFLFCPEKLDSKNKVE